MAGGLNTILGVNLVTPRGVIAHTEADSVQAPGELGEFELLPGHIPLLTALKPGVLTIGAKTRAKYAVGSGYLRVDPSGAVEILVEQAQAAADVDTEAAKKDLAAAEKDLASWGDKAMDGEYINVRARADWARARLAAASASH
ncbi:MAG: ATP synthase F1 subunit epsilon [Kofleriaceae bacterium]